MAAITPFDPYNQSFTLQTSDGTPFNVSISDLDSFILYKTQISINYGAQIGASIVLLIVLLLLTKPDKRGSPLFVINTLSLALNIIRNVLLCLYFTGPFTEVYTYFGQDYSRINLGDYANSVTATVFTVLVLLCVEISLCLQTRVVCVTLWKFYQQVIFAVSVLVATVAIGFRLAFCVENSKFIVNLEELSPIQWLASATNITTTISICWFCAVFVTKLGFALNQRRKLGLGQFGPMQILFIMGCQTLVIPAIFSILQYFVSNPAMGSNVLTSVAVFLPLSSLWASASIDSRTQASKEQNYSRAMLPSYTTGSPGPFKDHKTIGGSLSPSNTTSTRITSPNPPSPHDARHDKVLQDLEA